MNPTDQLVLFVAVVWLIVLAGFNLAVCDKDAAGVYELPLVHAAHDVQNAGNRAPSRCEDRHDQ